MLIGCFSGEPSACIELGQKKKIKGILLPLHIKDQGLERCLSLKVMWRFVVRLLEKAIYTL